MAGAAAAGGFPDRCPWPALLRLAWPLLHVPEERAPFMAPAPSPVLGDLARRTQPCHALRPRPSPPRVWCACRGRGGRGMPPMEPPAMPINPGMVMAPIIMPAAGARQPLAVDRGCSQAVPESRSSGCEEWRGCIRC